MQNAYARPFAEADGLCTSQFLSISFQSPWNGFSVEEIQYVDRILMANMSAKPGPQQQIANKLSLSAGFGRTGAFRQPIDAAADQAFQAGSNAVPPAPKVNAQGGASEGAIGKRVPQPLQKTNTISSTSVTVSPATSTTSTIPAENTSSSLRERNADATDSNARRPLQLYSLSIYLAGLLKLQEFFTDKAIANAHAFQYIAEDHVATMHESGYRRTHGPFEDLKQAGVWWRMDDGGCITIVVLGEVGRNIATVRVAKGTFVE